MKDIYGKDISTTIQFRRFGHLEGTSLEAQYPWPEDTRVSAGNGIVIVRDGKNYTTLFMEVYPPGAAFIRGEGETPQECEDSAWRQYQNALHCPAGGEHDWYSKGYKNGAAFCRACNTFKTKHYTGADLGQFCWSCGEPTLDWDEDTFFCPEHPTKRIKELRDNYDRLLGRS